MSTNQCNSLEFWSEFAKHTWERKPTAINDSFCTPPLTPDQLFDTVVQCCSPEAAESHVRLLFHIDNDPVEGDTAREFYARPEDCSFQGYSERVRAQIGNRDYCFLITYLEELSFPLWSWTRNLLGHLYQFTGMNNLGVFYALFFGNYKKTPFGVHFDPESVFHIPIVGLKKIRTWPHEFVSQHPEINKTHSYEKFLEDSTLLEAGPGGMIYWPSGAWHTAESNGELTVSLALSMFCFDDPVVPLANALLKEVVANTRNAEAAMRGGKQIVSIPFDPNNLSKNAERIPEPLAQAGARLREMTSESMLTAAWLKLVTGYGFINVPEPLKAEPLKPEHVIQGSSEYPIVWARLNENTFAASVNGHVFPVPASEHVETLFSLINNGQPLSVGRLIKQGTQLVSAFGGNSEEFVGELMRLLNHLLSLRGVHIVN